MNFLYKINRSWGYTILLSVVLGVLYFLPHYLFYSNDTCHQVSIFGINISGDISPIFANTISIIVDITIIFIVSFVLFYNYLNISGFIMFLVSLLLFTSNSSGKVSVNGSIAMILAVISILEIIRINLNENKVNCIINAMTLVLISSFFDVYCLYLIPIFILLIPILDGFSPRRFLIEIFVMVVAVLSILGYAYVFDKTDILLEYYSNVLIIGVADYSREVLIYKLPLFLVIIMTGISVFLYFSRDNSFKLKVKNIINFMCGCWLLLSPFMLIIDFYTNTFLSIYLLLSSFILTVNFINYKKSSNIIFYVLFILSLFLYSLRFWI